MLKIKETITVFKGLTEDYPVKFELAGVEKRCDNKSYSQNQLYLSSLNQ